MVRLKNRFIVGQVVWNNGSKDKFSDICLKDIQLALRDKIIELFGDVGVGEFGNSTTVKFLDSEFSKIFVFRTTRDCQSNAHFALSCITKLKDVDVTLRSLSVHSCPRTCVEGLKTVFGVFFANTTLKNIDREAAENKLVNMLTTVEL